MADRRWQRPVPVVGDTSTAAQRAADPGGWAFRTEARDAFYDIVGARRDVRRYRPDAVPAEVLDRILTAAHAAPSVGHSQPWRFVMVRDPARRERAALLADRERLRQAAQMAADPARRLLDLQLEGIREAPLGIVVCCDRRTASAGVLGRATFPDADMWSCATAIENLWLAARAEGLGMGWVTLFRPTDLAALIGLPDGVSTLGWLCLGWPDERPPAPGLQRAGWSRRMPLADVVFDEQWRGDVAAPTSHLADPETEIGALHAPDQVAVIAARDGADTLLSPPGSLGVLDRVADRVFALGHAGVLRHTGGALVLVAADHPVTALGVSVYPRSVTREVFTAAASGVAMGVRAAVSAGLRVVLVDAGVAGSFPAGNDLSGSETVEVVRVPEPLDGRGDLANTDAMSAPMTAHLIAAGEDIGHRAADGGIVALGEIGIGNTTVAACLAAALLGLDADDAVGLGAGADSGIVAAKRTVVAAALARWRTTGADDPLEVLTALGGPEFAVLAGVVRGAARAGAAIVLDGLATGVAALIAVRLEPAIAAHLVAGQRSRELVHAAVLTELGLEPLLDLRIRAGEGVGAALATGILNAALDIRSTTARTGT